ncbi:hypothetical protein BU26DRAFT_433650, partial [Trematosphaeria pertusa]
IATNKKRLYITLYSSRVVGNKKRRSLETFTFLIRLKAKKSIDIPSIRCYVKNNLTSE